MNYKNTKSYAAFMNSPYRSIKHESYFNVYDTLLKEYIGKEITFVEVGVLDGGSLFMWKNFFGEKARVIGIEINEHAKVWEEYGFEIFIGSQSDPNFWANFYETVGNVDVILDDGGHTYKQQIITVECSLDNIKSGGKIIIEDTYTSYEKEYGYPSKFTFIKYASNLVDGVNLRTPKLKTNKQVNKRISNISFFESIVCISINKSEYLSLAEGITNRGEILKKEAESLRYADDLKLTKTMNFLKSFKSLQYNQFFGKYLRYVAESFFKFLKSRANKKNNSKLRKYFKY